MAHNCVTGPLPSPFHVMCVTSHRRRCRQAQLATQHARGGLRHCELPRSLEINFPRHTRRHTTTPTGSEPYDNKSYPLIADSY